MGGTTLRVDTASARSAATSSAAVTLAALALFAAGAWLARATPRARVDQATLPPLRAVLLDTSASARASRAGWRSFVVRALADEARAASAAREELLVVTYSDVVARAYPAGDPEGFLARLSGRGDALLELEGASSGAPGERGLGTDLAGAVRVAAHVLGEPGRAPGRLVVIGEGTATNESGDASELGRVLTAAAEHVIELRRVPLTPATRGDLELVEACAPSVVPMGAAVALDLALAWRPPADGTGPGLVVVEVHDLDTSQRGPLLTSVVDAYPDRVVRVTGGASETSTLAARARASVAVVLPPLARGLHTLRVTARPASGEDALAHDDVQFVHIDVGDVPRVVAVAEDEALRSALARAFPRVADPADGNVTPELPVALELVPLADLSRALQGADVLLSVGVPLAALPAGDVAAHVAAGGGWLHAVGTDLLRVDGGALAGLLALRAAPPETPPREVLFLVDGSGSMKGLLWDRVRRALLEVVPEVRVEDAVVLRFFNRVLMDVVMRATSLDPEARLRELRRVLQVEAPGGATDIRGVLEDLLLEREGSAPAERPEGLIVLLSDGLSDSATMLAADTRASLANDRLGLRLVQIGDDAEGLSFLQRFLLPGEVVLRGGDLVALALQLREALHADRFVTDVALAPKPDGQAQRGVVGDLAQALARAMFRDPDTPPWVAGRVMRAELMPGAAAVLVTDALPVSTDPAPAGPVPALPAPASTEPGPAPLPAAPQALGSPVLAVVERGAGLVATLATLPSDLWCGTLAREPQRLTPTLLALAQRARERARPELVRVTAPFELESVAGAGGAAVVALEGVDPAWPVMLELVLHTPGPPDEFGRPTAELEVGRVSLTPEPLPGAPLRRVARIPLALAQAAAVGAPRGGSAQGGRGPAGATGGAGGGVVSLVASGSSTPLARLTLPRFTAAEGTTAELPVTAWLRGPWPEPAARTAAPLRAPHPLAPWCLALGAGLLAALHLPRGLRRVLWRRA
ncbi:MAG: vWA domain-containing protein [Planctomycetota bacterium]